MTAQSGTDTAAGAASFMDDEGFKTQMLKSDLILQPGSAVLTCVFLQKSAFCRNLSEYLFYKQNNEKFNL